MVAVYVLCLFSSQSLLINNTVRGLGRYLPAGAAGAAAGGHVRAHRRPLNAQARFAIHSTGGLTIFYTAQEHLL